MAKDNGTGKKKEIGQDGLWAEKVGAKGTMILMGYLAGVAIILIVAAVSLLGEVYTKKGKAGGDSVSMILLVIVLGALGGQIHCLRSVRAYVGNRNLKKSWVPMYLVNPLQGSMLGFVFYLLVRGGVMAVSENIGTASEVGLAGISALVGMFSDQAAEKLKAIAEAIFSSPKTEGWKDRGPGEAGK